MGLQILSSDTRLFDLEIAAESKVCRKDITGMLAAKGLVITELSTHF